MLLRCLLVLGRDHKVIHYMLDDCLLIVHICLVDFDRFLRAEVNHSVTEVHIDLDAAFLINFELCSWRALLNQAESVDMDL